jgi:hypothetical protein
MSKVEKAREKSESEGQRVGWVIMDLAPCTGESLAPLGYLRIL